jgi:hypothetical protein
VDGVKEQARKLLADFRGSVAKLSDANARLANSAFNLSDADRAVSRMPSGKEKSFALSRVLVLKKTLAAHGQRASVLNKAASGLWATLRAILKPIGMDPGALRGVGQVQIVLPVVAITALIFATSKLYNAVVNDTKRADLEAAKLKLLAEGKITAGELADVFDKPKSGLFADFGKIAAGAALLLLLPSLIQLTRRNA